MFFIDPYHIVSDWNSWSILCSQMINEIALLCELKLRNLGSVELGYVKLLKPELFLPSTVALWVNEYENGV